MLVAFVSLLFANLVVASKKRHRPTRLAGDLVAQRQLVERDGLVTFVRQRRPPRHPFGKQSLQPLDALSVRRQAVRGWLADSLSQNRRYASSYRPNPTSPDIS